MRNHVRRGTYFGYSSTSVGRTRSQLARERERQQRRRAKQRQRNSRNSRLRNVSEDGKTEIGWVPAIHRPSIWTRIWQPFWMLPLVICVGSVVLGILTPMVSNDLWHGLGLPLLFEGGANAARSILTTVASAMISVTTLVFSMTMVVLQLASSQFTPRILSTFLESRITQATLGVFTGTFLYSLTVLRTVRDSTSQSPQAVPELATTIAFLGVILSVAFFLGFIRHITTQIQVSKVIERTIDKTTTVMNRIFPTELPAENHGLHGWPIPEDYVGTPILAPASGGSVTYIDYQELVEMATDLGLVIDINIHIGDYCPGQIELGKIFARQLPDKEVIDDVAAMIQLGTNRTMRQDALFGIRQLVDIAERALSPGVNDPTTAVQVIDGLHHLFRKLVTRETPSGYVMGRDEMIRLVYQPQQVSQILVLGVEEISHWGKSSLTIPRRLKQMLLDLRSVTLPEYRSVIEELLELVESQTEPQQS